jgi:hypothetical protein
VSRSGDHATTGGHSGDLRSCRCHGRETAPQLGRPAVVPVSRSGDHATTGETCGPGDTCHNGRALGRPSVVPVSRSGDRATTGETVTQRAQFLGRYCGCTRTQRASGLLGTAPQNSIFSKALMPMRSGTSVPIAPVTSAIAMATHICQRKLGSENSMPVFSPNCRPTR